MRLDELYTAQLKQFADHRGTLMPVEFDDLPFVPQRVFYIVQHGTFNNEKYVRGKKANKVCQQYFYCLVGEVAITLSDGINPKQTFHLRAGQGLFIDKMIWSVYLCKAMPGHVNVYAVLASHPYDPNDYITDFDQFKKLANENK